MEPVWVAIGITGCSSLVAIGSAWGVTKFQVREMKKKYDSILFAKDGRLNLVPAVNCEDLRTKCGRENEKEHNCHAKKLEELKSMVREQSIKFDNFKDEHNKFQRGIAVHMELMADFVKRHEEVTR